MRRILIGILIGLYTFVLGVTATPLWLQLVRPSAKEKVIAEFAQSTNHAASIDKTIVPFCELANNPEKYNGQVVRIKARLSGFIHGMVLNDSDCLRADTQTAVFYDPGHEAEIRRDLKQARGSDNWLEPLDVIAVGTFWKVHPSYESDTIYDTASLRFEIIHIEEASMVR